MATEDQNPNSAGLSQKSAIDILKVINEEDKKVAKAVKEELPKIAAAVDLIVEALDNNNNVYFIGAGTSGRLGIMQQAEIPPTFNDKRFKAIMAGGNDAVFKSKEGAEDFREEGKKAIGKEANKGDVVIGISASGTTPYVIGALEKALEMGCKTIGISCNKNTQIESLADIAITLGVGPEVISGSTRMKAGTAQKMVLDMLSTVSMVKIGKTYGNLMVDVRATNNKLKERAKNIVMKIALIEYSKAEELLNISNYNIKCAVVMAKKGCSLKEAEVIVYANKGVLEKCL